MVENLDTAVYVRMLVEKAEVLYSLFREIDNAVGKTGMFENTVGGVEDRRV